MGAPVSVRHRPELWRRVHARLGVLGWTTGDLLVALHGADPPPGSRPGLSRMLRGRRSDRTAQETTSRADVESIARALGLRPSDLEDGASWRGIIAGAGSVPPEGADRPWDGGE